MRKFLCFLGFLAIVLITFVFVFYKKKEYVSLKEVVIVKYLDSNDLNKSVRFIKDSKWGILNKDTGLVIIKPEYDYIDDFYNGFAVVKKDNKYGVINENFDVIVEPKWSYINPYYNKYSIISAKNGKAGVIDDKGKVVVKPLYWDYISQFDSNAVARAKNFKDNKEVAIDAKGNIIKTFSE